MKRLLITFFTLIGLGSLHSQTLKGSNWLLVSIDNLSTGKAQMIGSKAKAALYFETDSTYNGAFCNRYEGKYSQTNESGLKMYHASATKVYCVGLNKLENDLLNHYTRVTRFRIENNELFLFTNDNIRITFKRH